jgi:hypothetical protein
LNEKRNTITKLTECTKNGAQREIIPINVFMRKEERSQIINLTLYLKELEKEEQRTSRKKEKKMRAH